MPEEPDNLILQHLRAIRGEMRDLRTLTLGLGDQFRALERRIGQVERRMGGLESRIDDLKDDLELMIKAELTGRLGNFETRLEAKFDTLSERVGALEKQP